jgi:hypothetical protein
MSPRSLACFLPLLLTVACAVSAAEPRESATVARIVVWQPKPGMARDFEEGYKRHLDWHRKNRDPWTWHGWMISSGERNGYFMDGTFSHEWGDLDSPVSPAADSADNNLNTAPYGDVRSAATYEAIAGEITPALLTSRLLTLWRFDLVPGAAAEFELSIGVELRAAGTPSHALLRPVNGATDYLLLMNAAKPSEYGVQAAFVRRLLEAVRRRSKGSPLITAYHTESAVYRADLSYSPELPAPR